MAIERQGISPSAVAESDRLLGSGPAASTASHGDGIDESLERSSTRNSVSTTNLEEPYAADLTPDNGTESENANDPRAYLEVGVHHDRFFQYSMFWEMVLFFVFGFVCSIAHYIYYHSRNGKPVGSSGKQQWALRYVNYSRTRGPNISKAVTY